MVGPVMFAYPDEETFSSEICDIQPSKSVCWSSTFDFSLSLKPSEIQNLRESFFHGHDNRLHPFRQNLFLFYRTPMGNTGCLTRGLTGMSSSRVRQKLRHDLKALRNEG